MSKAKKHLDNYQKFLTKGQIPKAIDALENVVQLMPKDVNHRKKLADLYFRAKRNAEAFSAYELVARSFAEGGFYLKAIAVYRQMQKIDPTQAMVYEQLAELNQKQGLMGQALSEYGELVSILEKEERYTEAAEVLSKMAKLDPSNLGVRIRVAESFCRSGDKEKGLGELNEISKELRKKGDMATLRKLYELFMRQFPEDLSIQAGMARSLISSGDPARALQLLQGLLKKAPENIDILGNLANAYRATKDHENERLTFKQMIKQNPDHLDFHKGYARACLDAGAADKALEHLEQCKQLFGAPEQQKALVSYYEKIHEMLEGDERIVSTLRELYTATGQDAKLEDLESHVGLMSDDGFGGFDQEAEELEPIEEVEELEPLEEVEELEEFEPLEEVEELAPLEEVEEFEPLEDDAEMAESFAVADEEFSEAADLLSAPDDDFAGFDVDGGESEADLSGTIDAQEDFAGGFEPEPAEEPEADEEVIDLDVPMEEAVLDLELEIEYDASEGEVDLSDDELSLDVEDESLDLDEDLDLGDAGIDSADLDLDVDLGGIDEEIAADDLDLAAGETELPAEEPEMGLDVSDELDLSAEIPEPLDEFGTEEGIDLTGEEPVPGDDFVVADGLDLDLDEETLDAPAEDLPLEANGFDEDELSLSAPDEELAAESETPDFLESGLETLEDMQANIGLNEPSAGEPAASYAPQRDLATELEEAEFYIHQGLFDEAEGVCRALQDEFPGAAEIESKLSEIAIHREQASAAPPAEDEEGFFDLASELSNESVFEAGGEMESLDERDLSRLDGILAEFKKGIEDQIDQEDTESHFNLGIAYKEMGLLDDAIQEFERVMRDPQRVVDCLTLTGICYAEKGDFGKAEETFKLGIGSAEATDEDLLSLNYELGIICEATGRGPEAAEYYRYVAERQPGFRDVNAKLEALASGGGGGNDSSSNGGDSRISFV